VDFHPHLDLRWVVSVPGYQEERGILAVPEPGAERTLYRVEVRPGFRRKVFVRDARSGQALAGVVALDSSGTTLAVTRADGSALLTAGEWPGLVTFEREDYEALEWDTSSHWLNFSHQVWMRHEDE
jgi:hypothetical protein